MEYGVEKLDTLDNAVCRSLQFKMTLYRGIERYGSSTGPFLSRTTLVVPPHSRRIWTSHVTRHSLWVNKRRLASGVRQLQIRIIRKSSLNRKHLRR